MCVDAEMPESEGRDSGRDTVAVFESPGGIQGMWNVSCRGKLWTNLAKSSYFFL